MRRPPEVNFARPRPPSERCPAELRPTGACLPAEAFQVGRDGRAACQRRSIDCPESGIRPSRSAPVGPEEGTLAFANSMNFEICWCRRGESNPHEV